MEYKGVDYLKRKLHEKQRRIDLRYRFYDMKNLPVDFGISTPPELRHWFSSLGWCAKAVDSLADRLVFREFKEDTFGMNDVFAMNNPDVLTDSAVQGALIGACSFIYISQDEDGFPRLQTLDGSRATGIIDPISGMLVEGYAVIEEAEHHVPVVEAYFIPGRTDFYYHDKNGVTMESVDNIAEYPLLVPIIFRPDAKRPFGHSRISRACMSLTESAIRTLKRTEITSEFYSFPQKWVSGLASDVEIDAWRANISSMLTVTKDADGDKPQFGQFTQQSVTPHVDELKAIASLFGGETGLTLDDLGFATENPASAEAIKAGHESLRLTARKSQRTFGNGFRNAGYLGACLRDNFPYQRSQIYYTIPKWNPIFEPDASMLSGIGDGLMKLSQAVPEYDVARLIDELTGF